MPNHYIFELENKWSDISTKFIAQLLTIIAFNKLFQVKTLVKKDNTIKFIVIKSRRSKTSVTKLA